VRMSLPRYVYDELLKRAKLEAPNEACGVIVITAPGVMEVVQIPNVADNPAREFAFDPRLQLKLIKSIHDENMRLVSIWHSHLIGSSKPSRTDLASAALQDHKIVNLIIFGREIFAYQIGETGEPYRTIDLVID